jgi:uncharacterized membrane protein
MADQSQPFLPTKRNPLTHAKHRKEVFWMVLFPAILGGLLLVAAVVGLIIMTVNEARVEQTVTPVEAVTAGDFSVEEQGMMLYERGTTSRLSSISQIWLIMPVCLFSLLFLGILAGLVFLVTKLINVLPGYMLKAQEALAMVSFRVKNLLDKAVEPLVKYNSFMASVRQVRLALRQQISDVFGRVDEGHGD